MKNLLILSLITLLSVSIKAQTVDNPGTPEQRADKLTGEMLIALPLDSNSLQYEQVHELNLKYARIIQREVIDKNASLWTMYWKGQDYHKKKEKELRLLLSESQWKAYQKLKNEHKKEIFNQLFD